MENKEQELIDEMNRANARHYLGDYSEMDICEAKLEGFRLGVAEEKAKHEKFVEEVLKELDHMIEFDSTEVFQQFRDNLVAQFIIDLKKRNHFSIHKIIDKLEEKYK